MTGLLALLPWLVIVGVVVLVLYRLDVRLVLTLAALILALLAGELPLVVRTFLGALAREAFVIPICTAMGFAFVLRQTQCDQHLVQLLVRPLRRFWMLLIPGVVVVGFITNIPVVSQAGAASTVGPVVIPLMLAVRISPVTAGASLLLGASIGGELFNPGAPELQVVSGEMGPRWEQEQKQAREEGRKPDPWFRKVSPNDLVTAARPLALLQLVVATGIFWWMSVGHERRYRQHLDSVGISDASQHKVAPEFQVNYLKAAIPLVPLVLLFLTGPPLSLITVDPGYLVAARESPTLAGPRLVGAAMLVGMVLATLSSPRQAGESVKAFFDGTGYAYTHVISLIVAATTFGKAAEVVGIQRDLHALIDLAPGILIPLAVAVSLLFAWVCGSGIAALQSLFPFFIEPARKLDVDPVNLGALTSLASAGGRTMSPVAAVTLICSSLTQTQPMDLVRRVAVPIVVGMGVVTLMRLVFPALL